MGDRWRATHDRALILWLHRRWNPGLFELAGQYSHLRPSDFPAERFNSWTHRSGGHFDGFTLAHIDDERAVVQELWAKSTGLSDWNVPNWDSRDLRRLDETWELVRRIQETAGRPTFVRVPNDNPFGRLFAIRFQLPLETSLLLATRRPGFVRYVRLPAGYGIRPYGVGDEVAYASIHNRCFNASVDADEMRRWASGPRQESFTATFHGNPVGFFIAEVRRGRRLGDFNLAVSEGHRGRRIGTALLAAGLRSFERREVTTVIADHWATNAPAVEFYRRHGFGIARTYDFFRIDEATLEVPKPVGADPEGRAARLRRYRQLRRFDRVSRREHRRQDHEVRYCGNLRRRRCRNLRRSTCEDQRTTCPHAVYL